MYMGIQDIPEFDRLNTPEKILLVEDLWDHIAAKPSTVPVPQSHVNELERRLDRQTAQPGALLSLEE
jgi:putative addiction module component (TIGR02574 family)